MKKVFFLLVLTVLFSCTKDDSPSPITDPCTGIVCKNGGHCANGSCVCAAGYKGSDCSLQITPTKITITKIQVTKFPATNANGGGWDLTSGPDIRPQISKGSIILWLSPSYSEDANQSTIYNFTLSTPINITTPTDQYTISLYDYDTISDEWMGGWYFTPYSNTNGFPPTLVVGDATLSFTLHLTYTWN